MAYPIANQEPIMVVKEPLQRIEEVKQTIMVVKEHNLDDDPIDQTCSDLHMASEISIGDDIKGVGYDAEEVAQVQALTEPILPSRDQLKPNRKMACLVANQELDYQPPQRKEEVTQVSVDQFGVLPVTVTVSSNNFANRSGSNSIICDSEVTMDANNVVALYSEMYEGISIELPPELVADKVPSTVKALTDGAALSVSSQLSTVAIPCDGVNGPDVFHSIRSPQKDPRYAETTTPSYSEPHLEQQSLLTVGDRELFSSEQPLASDGRSIPPRNVVTCLDRSGSTRWRLPGSGNADSVSSFELPPQILLTDPEGTGNDPVESVVLTTDDSNALAISHVDPELSPNANYSNVISGALIHDGTCVVNSCTMLEVGKGMLDIEELSEQIDTLLIPPFLPLTLGVKIILLDLMGFKPMEVSYHGDSEWSCAILRFGGDNGVRIFDPGPFDVSKSIRYGTLEDLTAALSTGVNNEGEDRVGTTGIAVEAKIWCHFHSAYFFFPP